MSVEKNAKTGRRKVYMICVIIPLRLGVLAFFSSIGPLSPFLQEFDFHLPSVPGHGSDIFPFDRLL